MSDFARAARRALYSTVAAGSLISGALLAAAPAFADTPTETALPELTITAERREENLQTVSVSATVLNAAAMQEQGVTRMSDLQQVSPSLAINTYNRSTFINIRGVGIAQSAPTSSPGVAYYVNGALIPHEQVIGLTFFDLDSIEVLRGPQGTLTGQNSTGGAIYARSPRPQFGHWSGYLDETFGEYGASRSIAAVNIPILSNIAVRASAVHDVRGSFTTNIGPSPYAPLPQHNPSQPGNVDVWAYRADVRYQPIEQLNLNVRYEWFRSDTFYNAIKNRGDLVTADPFTIEEDGVSFQRLHGYRVGGEVNWDVFSGARVRWLTDYQHFTSEDMSDGDRTATAPPQPPTANQGRLGYALTGFNTISHELDLLSTDEASPVQWVVGAYYLDEDIPVLLLRYNRDTVFPINAPTSTTRAIAHNTTKSLFGQVNWTVTPQVELVAGVRYSQDQQLYDRIAPAAVQGVARSEETTGRVAINYNPTEDLLLYASLSRGYKAGGVNLTAGDPAIAPETNLVGEIGFKAQVLDHHLRINGAVFSSKYEGLQLGSTRTNLAVPPVPPALPIIINIPESRIWGGELEFTGAFDRLEFNLGVGYLHAEMSQDAFLSDNTPVPPSPAVTLLVPAGTTLPFSPQWTVNAGIQYGFDFAGGTITPRMQLAYLADQFAAPYHQTASQRAATFVPAHTVVDLRVTWQPSAMWRVEGFVTNILDETYIAAQVQNSSTATGGAIYGAPRQIGGRVTVRFD